MPSLVNDVQVTVENEPGIDAAREGAVQLPIKSSEQATKEFLAVLQNLSKDVEKITGATLSAVERSSKSTLLFVAVVLGFLMMAAPCILIMVKGSLAATMAEYLTTSISGSVLALVGLLGVFLTSRSMRETSSNVHAKSMQQLDAQRRNAEAERDLILGQGHATEQRAEMK